MATAKVTAWLLLLLGRCVRRSMDGEQRAQAGRQGDDYQWRAGRLEGWKARRQRGRWLSVRLSYCLGLFPRLFPRLSTSV